MRLPRHVKGRFGYTTGACATAALKGALLCLRGERRERVKIRLPIGLEAEFVLHSLSRNGTRARASVVKDAGDDPDVTNGAEIVVEAEVLPGRGEVIFVAGEGVGMVTKPGLGIPLGEPAITPVPRRMMEKVVREVLGPDFLKSRVKVTVSIPGGEELARHTLNPRLGIKGGLSILGTKGIVVPFSTAAYKASIVKAYHVARALGIEEVVLTTGGRSEAFCQKILPGLPEEAFVQIGDFVGFALRSARRNGFRKIYLGMMLGKMAKVALGLPNTHAKYGEVPLDFLSSLAEELGAGGELLKRLEAAGTARHFLEIMKAEGKEFLRPLGERLSSVAAREAASLAGGEVVLEALLLDFDGALIARAVYDPRNRLP